MSSFCEAVQYQCFRNQTVQVIAVGDNCVQTFDSFYDSEAVTKTKNEDYEDSEDKLDILPHFEEFCSSETCGNQGVCIETKVNGKVDMKRCHCNRKYTGAYCQSLGDGIGGSTGEGEKL